MRSLVGRSRRSSAGGARASATVRLAAVLAISVGSLGASPTVRARAVDGLAGNSFTSEELGWSVAFDDATFDAERTDEAGYQGVRLTGDDAEANLRVFDDGITDTGDCLDALLRFVSETSDGVADLEPATDLKSPDTAPNAESRLYAGTVAKEDVVVYLECRDLVGGTLAVDVTVTAERYDAVRPDVEALLAGIETIDPKELQDATEDETPTPEASSADPEGADASPAAAEANQDDGSAPEPHADGDRLGEDQAAGFDVDFYASRLGYRVAIDPEAFTITEELGSRGVDLAATDEELTVSVLAVADPSIDVCLDREVATVRANPDNASVSPARGTRPPRTADTASGRVLRVVEDTVRQGRLVVYVECRPLADAGEGGDPTFVVVRATSGAASFRSTRTLLERVLAGITRDGESVGEDPPDADRDAPSGTAVASATDLSAGVFVGETIPFRIEWNPAYWAASASEVGLTLSAVDGASLLSVEQYDVGPDSGFTEAGCVLGPVEDLGATLPDLTQVAPPGERAIAWPAGVGNTLAAGTVTFDDGSTATQLLAVGCLELVPARRYLRFVFATVDVVYPTSVVQLDDILSSLTVDDQSFA